MPLIIYWNGHHSQLIQFTNVNKQNLNEIGQTFSIAYNSLKLSIQSMYMRNGFALNKKSPLKRIISFYSFRHSQNYQFIRKSLKGIHFQLSLRFCFWD